MIQGIQMIGGFADTSGYGAGGRGYAKAALKAGIKVCLKLISFEKDRPPMGEDTQFIEISDFKAQNKQS